MASFIDEAKNQVLTALKEAGIQAGRTTVADVLQEHMTIKVDITV